MSVVAEPRFTLEDFGRMLRAPLRDKSYQQTRLGPAVREYLAWKRLSRRASRTLDAIERELARLCVLLPDREVGDVATEDLMLVLEHVPEGSWRKVKTLYNGFFKWAVDFDHITKNPVSRLPAIKPNATPVYDLFSEAERSRVLIAAQRSLLPARNVLGVLCFQELGIRKEEGRLLQPKHFDQHNRVVVVTGKGNKERVVNYSDELHIALLDFLATPIPRVRMRDRDGWYYVEREPTDEDFVFFPSGVTGEHKGRESQLLWADPTRAMTASPMHHWWKTLIGAAGVRYRSMHMNRHTVGTDLVEAGVDSFTVKDWLGHADTRTTEVYVHNTRGRLQTAASKLSDYRRGDRTA